MSRFKSGDIIPVTTLNQIEDYINQLYNSLNSNQIVKDLYDVWQGIPTGDESASINDEIEAILQKQNSYINQ